MVYRVDVKHVTSFLHEVDIFRGLAERQLDRIAGLCEEWSFRAGDYLGVQNEQGTRLYIIRHGEITVTTSTDEMNAVVRTVRERETLPVAVLFEPPILVTTAKAATDGGYSKSQAARAMRTGSKDRHACLQVGVRYSYEQIPIYPAASVRHAGLDNKH